jgi:carbon-monoxide dehydrogenase small subunit
VIEVVATVNRERILRAVPDDQLLCDFLREGLGLLGTRVGCNEGVCGSCTVLVDGCEVRGCLMLAAQVDGCEVLTVEGLARGRELHPLQRAFVEFGAVQCGFCTAGILMTATALLDANPHPTEAEIREALAGNLCRCTGYGKVIEAVLAARPSSPYHGAPSSPQPPGPLSRKRERGSPGDTDGSGKSMRRVG